MLFIMLFVHNNRCLPLTGLLTLLQWTIQPHRESFEIFQKYVSNISWNISRQKISWNFTSLHIKRTRQVERSFQTSTISLEWPLSIQLIMIICLIAIAQHGSGYEIISVLLSVCLSVSAHTVAFFVRFWWNFTESFGSRKVKTSSLGDQNPSVLTC